jgi:Family of unknown function (DUF6529)
MSSYEPKSDHYAACRPRTGSGAFDREPPEWRFIDAIPRRQVMTGAAQPRHARLFVPLVIGALVSVSLGLYGRYHHPTGFAIDIAGFSGPLAVKSWLASIAVFFALIQLFSALVIYGKIRLPRNPTWIGALHRWSGRIAFLVTIPVAVHCLYALGFQHYSTRVLIHSLLGCLFFGVFTVKMLVLSTRRGMAAWILPLVGGLTFAVLIGIWLTSALWFFSTSGVHF